MTTHKPPGWDVPGGDRMLRKEADISNAGSDADGRPRAFAAPSATRRNGRNRRLCWPYQLASTGKTISNYPDMCNQPSWVDTHP
jgi:hypothetical protein